MGVILMNLKPLLIRSIATISLIFYGFTNVLFAHSAETNFWKERGNVVKKQNNELVLANLPMSPTPRPGIIPIPGLSSLSKAQFPAGIAPFTGTPTEIQFLSSLLPFGTFRKITQPKSPNPNHQTIIHIQDVHMNREAQKNISLAIQNLVGQQKVNWVAIEGGFGPIDLSVFHQFPDQKTVKEAADYMLRENNIAGPLHAMFSSTAHRHSPTILGVDDFTHYRSNVEAYKRSAPLVKLHKEQWTRRRAEIQSKKINTLNPPLARFDAVVESYRRGDTSLGGFAQELKRFQPRTSISTFKMFASFIEALNLEGSLDFSRVEHERSLVLSRLTPKLTSPQTKNLIDTTLAYRSGNISHANFYEYLRTLSLKNGVDMTAYPAMNAYLRYMLLSESIDGEKLFSEISGLEKSTFDHLMQTPQERELIQESKRVYLVGKLLDFALTKEEWEEYKLNPSLGTWAQTTETSLAPFEDFYREAEIRDEMMAKNFLKALKGQGTSVLVTGGFHSSGITQRLADSGHTVVSFVPKITKVDTSEGTQYLSLFTQEKTPLEKLFEGEKLFLSPEQGTTAQIRLLGLLICCATFLRGTVADPTITSFFKYSWQIPMASFHKKSKRAVRLSTEKFSLEVNYPELFFDKKIFISFDRFIPVRALVAPLSAWIISQITGIFPDNSYFFAVYICAVSIGFLLRIGLHPSLPISALGKSTSLFPRIKNSNNLSLGPWLFSIGFTATRKIRQQTNDAAVMKIIISQSLDVISKNPEILETQRLPKNIQENFLMEIRDEKARNGVVEKFLPFFLPLLLERKKARKSIDVNHLATLIASSLVFTTDGTRLFRFDVSTFRQFIRRIIAAKSNSNEKTLTLRHLGASSGEEPYSAAIIIHQELIRRHRDMGVNSSADDWIKEWDIQIDAFDKRFSNLERIQNGSFRSTIPQNMQRINEIELTAHEKEQYLKSNQMSLQLKTWIHPIFIDLEEPDYLDHLKKPYDVTFACNVLPYLTHRAQRRVIEIITESRSPSHLFLFGGIGSNIDFAIEYSYGKITNPEKWPYFYKSTLQSWREYLTRQNEWSPVGFVDSLFHLGIFGFSQDASLARSFLNSPANDIRETATWALERMKKETSSPHSQVPTPGAWGLWAHLGLNKILGLKWIGHIESWITLGSIAALLEWYAPQGPPALFIVVALITVLNFFIHLFTGVLDQNAELKKLPDNKGRWNPTPGPSPDGEGNYFASAARATLTASSAYMGLIAILPAMFIGGEGWIPWLAKWGLVILGALYGGWVHGNLSVRGLAWSRSFAGTFTTQIDEPKWNSIAKRILWIAVKMIAVANEGKHSVKIGGHQAASASALHLMMAVHLFVRRPDDVVSDKPHASPIYHAIQYLIGNLNKESLRKLRDANAAGKGDAGLQSYPSMKDPDFMDAPTGSVGLGPAAMVGAAISHRMLKNQRFPVAENPRFISIVGDAESDEGNFQEILDEAARYKLGNVIHLVDYNRMSLDGYRDSQHRKALLGLYRAKGWNVVELRWGRKMQSAFLKRNGGVFKEVLENLEDTFFTKLTAHEAATIRTMLLGVAQKLQNKQGTKKVTPLKNFLAQYSDTDLKNLFMDVGGHDLKLLVDTLNSIPADGGVPVVIVADTHKGWGLPEMLGKHDNHMLRAKDPGLAQLATEAGVTPDEDPFPRFEYGTAEELALRPRWKWRRQPPISIGHKEIAGPVPDRIEPAPSNRRSVSTHEYMNDVLTRMSRIAATPANDLSPEDRPLKSFAERIIKIFPDVGLSTMLNKYDEIFTVNGDPHQDLMDQLDSSHESKSPRSSPNGRVVRLGIKEMAAVTIGAALGKMEPVFGVRMIPILVGYPMFLARRAMDALHHGAYWGTRMLIIGTPSGSTTAPEGAQHQSVEDPAIMLSIPNTEIWDPAFPQELEMVFPHVLKGISQPTNEKDGYIPYIRLTTLQLEHNTLLDHLKSHVANQGKSDEDILKEWRQDVLEGGYRLLDYRGYEGYDPAQNVVNILAAGVMAHEAIKASKKLWEEHRIYANVIVASSATKLKRTHSRHLRQLIPIEEMTDTPLVTVADATPEYLSGIGALADVRGSVTDLGAKDFGFSARAPEALYQHHKIDADLIVKAAMGESLEERQPTTQVPGAWGLWAHLGLNKILGLKWIGHIESWITLGAIAALLEWYAPQGPPALFIVVALITVLNFFIHLCTGVLDSGGSPGRSKSGVTLPQYFSGDTSPGKVAAQRAVLDQNAELKKLPDNKGRWHPTPGPSPDGEGNYFASAARATLTASSAYMGLIAILPAMFIGGEGWIPWLAKWGLVILGALYGGWVHGETNLSTHFRFSPVKFKTTALLLGMFALLFQQINFAEGYEALIAKLVLAGSFALAMSAAELRYGDDDLLEDFERELRKFHVSCLSYLIETNVRDQQLKSERRDAARNALVAFMNQYRERLQNIPQIYPDRLLEIFNENSLKIADLNNVVDAISKVEAMAEAAAMPHEGVVVPKEQRSPKPKKNIFGEDIDAEEDDDLLPEQKTPSFNDAEAVSDVGLSKKLRQLFEQYETVFGNHIKAKRANKQKSQASLNALADQISEGRTVIQGKPADYPSSAKVCQDYGFPLDTQSQADFISAYSRSMEVAAVGYRYMANRTYLVRIPDDGRLGLFPGERVSFNRAFSQPAIVKVYWDDTDQRVVLDACSIGSRPWLLRRMYWDDAAKRFVNIHSLRDREAVGYRRIPAVQFPNHEEWANMNVPDSVSFDYQKFLGATRLEATQAGRAIVERLVRNGVLPVDGRTGQIPARAARQVMYTAAAMIQEEYDLWSVAERLLHARGVDATSTRIDRERTKIWLFLTGGSRHNKDKPNDHNPNAAYIANSASFGKDGYRLSRLDALYVVIEGEMMAQSQAVTEWGEAKKITGLPPSLEQEQFCAAFSFTRTKRHIWVRRGSHVLVNVEELRSYLSSLNEFDTPLAIDEVFLRDTLAKNLAAGRNDGPYLNGPAAMTYLGLEKGRHQSFVQLMSPVNDKENLWFVRRGQIFFVEKNLKAWVEKLSVGAASREQSQTDMPSLSKGGKKIIADIVKVAYRRKSGGTLLRPAKAMRYLGLNKDQSQSFRRWVAAGGAGSFLVWCGGQLFYKRADLIDWVGRFVHDEQTQLLPLRTPKQRIRAKIIARILKKHLKKELGALLTPAEAMVKVKSFRKAWRRWVTYMESIDESSVWIVRSGVRLVLQKRLFSWRDRLAKSKHLKGKPTSETRETLQNIAWKKLEAEHGKLLSPEKAMHCIGLGRDALRPFEANFSHTHGKTGKPLYLQRAGAKFYIRSALLEWKKSLLSREGVYDYELTTGGKTIVANLLRKEFEKKNGKLLSPLQAMKRIGWSRWQTQTFIELHQKTETGDPIVIRLGNLNFFSEKSLARWMEEQKVRLDEARHNYGTKSGPAVLIEFPKAMSIIGWHPKQAGYFMTHTEQLQAPDVVVNVGGKAYVVLHQLELWKARRDAERAGGAAPALKAQSTSNRAILRGWNPYSLRTDVLFVPDDEFLKVIWWLFNLPEFFRDHPGTWWKQLMRFAGLLAVNAAILAPPFSLFFLPIDYGVFELNLLVLWWFFSIGLTYIHALSSPSYEPPWHLKLAVGPVYAAQFLTHALYNLFTHYIGAALSAEPSRSSAPKNDIAQQLDDVIGVPVELGIGKKYEETVRDLTRRDRSQVEPPTVRKIQSALPNFNPQFHPIDINLSREWEKRVPLPGPFDVYSEYAEAVYYLRGYLIGCGVTEDQLRQEQFELDHHSTLRCPLPELIRRTIFILHRYAPDQSAVWRDHHLIWMSGEIRDVRNAAQGVINERMRRVAETQPENIPETIFALLQSERMMITLILVALGIAKKTDSVFLSHFHGINDLLFEQVQGIAVDGRAIPLEKLKVVNARLIEHFRFSFDILKVTRNRTDTVKAMLSENQRVVDLLRTSNVSVAALYLKKALFFFLAEKSRESQFDMQKEMGDFFMSISDLIRSLEKHSSSPKIIFTENFSFVAHVLDAMQQLGFENILPKHLPVKAIENLKAAGDFEFNPLLSDVKGHRFRFSFGGYPMVFERILGAVIFIVGAGWFICGAWDQAFLSVALICVPAVIFGWRFHGFFNRLAGRLGWFSMSLYPGADEGNREIFIPIPGSNQPILYRHSASHYDDWTVGVYRHNNYPDAQGSFIKSIEQWWKEGAEDSVFKLPQMQEHFFWLLDNIYTPQLEVADEVHDRLSYEMKKYFEILCRYGPGFMGYALLRLVILENTLKPLVSKDPRAIKHLWLVKFLQMRIRDQEPGTFGSTLASFALLRPEFAKEVEALLESTNLWEGVWTKGGTQPHQEFTASFWARIIGLDLINNITDQNQKKLLIEFLAELLPINEEKRHAWDNPLTGFMAKLQAQERVTHIHIEPTQLIERNAKEGALGNYLQFQLRLVQALIETQRFRRIILTDKHSPYQFDKPDHTTPFGSFMTKVKKICDEYNVEILHSTEFLNEGNSKQNQEPFISLGFSAPAPETDSLYVFHEIMAELRQFPPFNPKHYLKGVVHQIHETTPTRDTNRTVGLEISSKKNTSTIWAHSIYGMGHMNFYQYAFVTSSLRDDNKESSGPTGAPSLKKEFRDSLNPENSLISHVLARLAVGPENSLGMENVGLMIFGVIGIWMLGPVWGLCAVVGGFALLHFKQFRRRYKSWRAQNESGWAAFWWAKNLTVFLAAATVLTTALNLPALVIHFSQRFIQPFNPVYTSIGFPHILAILAITAVGWWFHGFINPHIQDWGFTPMSLRGPTCISIKILGPSKLIDFSYDNPYLNPESNHDEIAAHNYQPNDSSELSNLINQWWKDNPGLSYLTNRHFKTHYFWLLENVYSQDFHLEPAVRHHLAQSLEHYFQSIEEKNEDFLLFALIRLIIALHNVGKQNEEYIPGWVGAHKNLLLGLIGQLTGEFDSAPEWTPEFIEFTLNYLASHEPALLPQIDFLRNSKNFIDENRKSVDRKKIKKGSIGNISGPDWNYQSYAPNLKNRRERELYKRFVRALYPNTEEKMELWNFPLDAFMTRLDSEKYLSRGIRHIHIQSDRDAQVALSKVFNRYLQFQIDLLNRLVSDGGFRLIVFDLAHSAAPVGATPGQVQTLKDWVNQSLEEDKKSDPQYVKEELNIISHIFKGNDQEIKKFQLDYWFKLREIRHQQAIKIEITNDTLKRYVNSIPGKFISVGFEPVYQKNSTLTVLHLVTNEYQKDTFCTRDALASAVNAQMLPKKSVGIAIQDNSALNEFLTAPPDTNIEYNQLKNFDFAFVTTNQGGSDPDFSMDYDPDPTSRIRPPNPEFNSPLPDAPSWVGMACISIWNWLGQFWRPFLGNARMATAAVFIGAGIDFISSVNFFLFLILPAAIWACSIPVTTRGSRRTPDKNPEKTNNSTNSDWRTHPLTRSPSTWKKILRQA
ncbi:MAG: hypothetical protein KCHDKBKB_02611 [Elusimicrobia bacterium]|nr:hypothetical protein [Elusimicrobiota bacterium]